MSGPRVIIGDWQAVPATNRLIGPDGEVEVEPRVMDLLMLLASKPGELFSKTEIADALWGDVHVNDDALTRSVFKLRKALGDDARNTRYIATVPKRGYRLIAEVSYPPAPAQTAEGPAANRFGRIHWLGLAACLLILVAGLVFFGSNTSTPTDDTAPAANDERIARADGFYSQFTRTDNEAALQLYQSVLNETPDNAAALAGLSNALTQRVIRYQGKTEGEADRTTLTEALESGWLQSDEAVTRLDRAIALAQQATEIDPSHARAWRALGLALAARQHFEAAERAYERALVINPDDWGTMINLSELAGLMGQPARSTPYLEQAWTAMDRSYQTDPVAIRPWHSEVGLAIAEAKVAASQPQEAELWYRRVLALDPLNAEAVRGLAALLRQYGDREAANELCRDLARATDETC